MTIFSFFFLEFYREIYLFIRNHDGDSGFCGEKERKKERKRCLSQEGGNGLWYLR